jgi:hypothetical protein
MSIVNIEPSRTFLNSGNISYYTPGNVGIGKTDPSYTLDVLGDLNTDGKIKENGSDLIPSGMIIMWYGSIASIPIGWTLCNGTNGAPNLTNRFVICGNVTQHNMTMTDITGSNTLIGGSTDSVLLQHSHTMTTDISGEHIHTYRRNTSGGSATWRTGTSKYENRSTSTNGAHTHTYTTNFTGVSRVNANIPPYIAIAYIMKL